MMPFRFSHRLATLAAAAVLSAHVYAAATDAAPVVAAAATAVAKPVTAAKTATPAKPGTEPADDKPALPTAQQFQTQIKKQDGRIHQLEQANQDALARNQELQLSNDNLTVQIQVLQSERSAQMFLYGAGTLAAGAFFGFLFCNYVQGKRNRRW